MKRLFVLAAAIAAASAANVWAGEQPKAGGSAAQPAAGAGVQVLNVWGGGNLTPVVHRKHRQDRPPDRRPEEGHDRDHRGPRQSQQDFQAQNAERIKPALDAMTAAFKGKDKEAIAKAQKAYQEVYAPMYEAVKKFQKELDAVLTPEQKAKQQEQQFDGWLRL